MIDTNQRFSKRSLGLIVLFLIASISSALPLLAPFIGLGTGEDYFFYKAAGIARKYHLIYLLAILMAAVLLAIRKHLILPVHYLAERCRHLAEGCRRAFKIKNFSLTIISLIVALFLAETCGQFYLYFKSGISVEKLLTQETFPVDGNTRRVEDERSVVVIPNSGPFDANGFRKGTYSYSRKTDNIVFIGDSVLYGFKVEDHETVPSYFGKLLAGTHSTLGVINAAYPSFSLDQAIHRYIYEIKDKFPTRVLILQIYDPVMVFLGTLDKWNRRINWSNYQTVTNRKLAIHPPLSILKHSSIFYFIVKSNIFAAEINHNLTEEEKEIIFTSGVIESLKIFEEAVKGNVDLVVILPVTPPLKFRDEFKLVKVLNKQLRDFAISRDGFSYLDTWKLFVGNDKQNFIDECCHLTPFGAQRQAQAIFDFLSQYCQREDDCGESLSFLKHLQ
jgi:hypothetical protein